MPKQAQPHEVIIVGDDFTPGTIANAEIDRLLGFDTCMLDDKAIRSEKFECRFAPDYCETPELITSELQKIGLDPLILPSVDLAAYKLDQDYSPMLTASFVYAGEYHVTKPFNTEAQALACVLWYVLAYHT